MGSRTERPRETSDRPQVELIEIVSGPDAAAQAARGRRLDAVPASFWRAIVAVGLVAALIGVAAVEVVGASDRHANRSAGVSRERALALPGPGGVAAAYGYPPRCLTVTMREGDRDYARADFSRRSQCGRYTWAPTAIFHRVGGVWYRVLDAVQYRCPVDSLPTAVQVALDVCPAKPGLAGIH